jgi:hypothetical protein
MKRLNIAVSVFVAAWLTMSHNALGDSPQALPQVSSIAPATLASVKQRVMAGDASLQPAVDALMKSAASAMKTSPASVMDKPEAFPGSDKHDYVSYAPYFWPNPDTKDGLPYVRHDGKRNREQMAKGDAPRFEKMIGAVTTLALAYELSDKEAYAEHAALLLRTWFLDPATKMNPNFTHAQAVLGVNGGRGTGLIEFSGMPHLLDSLGMLKTSKSWTGLDQAAMTAWLIHYADWIATSKEADDERAAANNHGSWFDTHEVSLLLYLGKTKEAHHICELAKTKRIARQIEPDGHQPLEEARADGFGYSVFNINALFELAALAERVDVDLWHFETSDGRSVRKALEYLSAYTDPEKKWPHNQLNALNRNALLPALLRAVVVYGEDAFGAALKRLSAEDAAKDRIRFTIGK